jgi:regulator of sirC expression with transglutaminase-like and TPR domain
VLWLLLLASPEVAARHEQEGVRLLIENRLAEAQKELEKCVMLDPDASSCHRHLGVLFAKVDDSKRSLHHYRLYVTLDPYAEDAGVVRRMIRDAGGDPIPDPPPRALMPKPAGTAPISKELESLARSIGQEGERALLAGGRDRARTLLEACVELNPAAAACHRSLGVLFAQIDDTKRAIAHYKRYVALAPDSADAARVQKIIVDAERKR